MRAFWNTGKDTPERMAAFVLLKDEKGWTAETADVDIVKKKTNEWRAEFAAQTKETKLVLNLKIIFLIVQAFWDIMFYVWLIFCSVFQ